MPAFRILNAFPVYLDLAGKPADGGSLRFYESGTTTPKSVYGDPGLSINNGAEVGIEADGRTAVEVWGDGNYRVRLYDADNTLIAEADNVEIAGGDAATIPALIDGYFLTNSGGLMLWAPVRQLPDPEGQDGKALVADGDGYLFKSFPEAPAPVDPEIVVGAGLFRGGVSTDETKFLLQHGSGSAPSTGGKTTSAAVTFAQAFAAAPSVVITPKNANAGGVVARAYVSSVSATGCTANFSNLTGGTSAENNPASNINASIGFYYIAVGTVEVAAD